MLRFYCVRYKEKDHWHIRQFEADEGNYAIWDYIGRCNEAFYDQAEFVLLLHKDEEDAVRFSMGRKSETQIIYLANWKKGENKHE